MRYANQTVTAPGVVGVPTGVKESGAVADFRPELFLVQIERHGYRLAWSQAVCCPCKLPNDQVEQADPNCALCRGTGWLMHRPAPAVPDIDRTIGELDDLQRAILADNASPIMGVMSSFSPGETPHDQVMRRIEGTSTVTVRAENKLGYHDRIVNLDSLIVYSQVANTPDTVAFPLRYPVVRVNVLRSVTTEYVVGVDFTLVAGVITWVANPAPLTGTRAPPAGTRLAAHYYCHPAWRVIEHPHATRATLKKFKTKLPKGTWVDMPVQAAVRYEFLL
jgi:hypothetical protein